MPTVTVTLTVLAPGTQVAAAPLATTVTPLRIATVAVGTVEVAVITSVAFAVTVA